MDLLRWILLGLGLLLIAAVWFHGRRNRPAHEESLFESARRRWRERSTEMAPDAGRDPGELDLPERDDPDFDFDPGELDALFDRDRESTEAALGRSQHQQPATAKPEGRATAARDERAAALTDDDYPEDDSPEGDTPEGDTPDDQPPEQGLPQDKPPPRRPHAPAARGDTDAGTDGHAPAGSAQVESQPGSREHAGDDEAAPQGRAPEREGAARSGGKRRAEREPEHDGEVGEERIVVLYVVAPRGERLDGASLHEAFATLGLEYGELEIFHGRDDSGRKVFSIANATEPGTFDPATMADLQTPGVALFARLPGPQSPTRTFDAMAHTARRLAEMLGARALDERQSTLTRQTEQAMRDELLEYEHRRARHRR